VLALRKHIANHVVKNSYDPLRRSADRVYDECHAFREMLDVDGEIAINEDTSDKTKDSA